MGTNIFNMATSSFSLHRGPIFTDLLLVDEINRTSPRTQSALLEAMNERQVTIDGRSHTLPTPFMVIATQNPVEHHGTYPLPESQLDRFLMRLRVGYPDSASERDILRNFAEPGAVIDPVLSAEEILPLQAMVHRVTVDESLVDYILAIIAKTRAHDSLALGVSPRGSQALYRAAQALALAEGRDYAIPDDIKRVAGPVCAHRVVVNARAALAQRRGDLGDRVIEEILSQVDVPL
jgi:MoxR-like ATPase